MEELNRYSGKAIDMLFEYGPQLLLAIFTLIIGFWVIKVIRKGLSKLLDKRKVDVTLTPYIVSFISITLKILLIVSVMAMVGVEMTSFVAILGAAGLAIGLSLSGTLQNFSGGALILLFKPFKVGDYIEAQGYAGTVKEIQIFNTILKTPDNKTIIIPNGGLSTGSMVNYSAEELRRVDFKFGIGYGDDIDKAKRILKEITEKHELILNEPETFIALSELGDSSVNFVVRAWVKTPDYWKVYFEITETVKKTFDKEGISIPFPQRDIHVYNEK